tara:strand:- start:6051 stop:9647 length:3597 start_codon:yes stop_codon:yes gene_type:complete
LNADSKFSDYEQMFKKLQSKEKKQNRILNAVDSFLAKQPEEKEKGTFEKSPIRNELLSKIDNFLAMDPILSPPAQVDPVPDLSSPEEEPSAMPGQMILLKGNPAKVQKLDYDTKQIEITQNGVKSRIDWKSQDVQIMDILSQAEKVVKDVNNDLLRLESSAQIDSKITDIKTGLENFKDVLDNHIALFKKNMDLETEKLKLIQNLPEKFDQTQDKDVQRFLQSIAEVNNLLLQLEDQYTKTVKSGDSMLQQQIDSIMEIVKNTTAKYSGFQLQNQGKYVSALNVSMQNRSLVQNLDDVLQRIDLRYLSVEGEKLRTKNESLQQQIIAIQKDLITEKMDQKSALFKQHKMLEQTFQAREKQKKDVERIAQEAELKLEDVKKTAVLSEQTLREGFEKRIDSIQQDNTQKEFALERLRLKQKVDDVEISVLKKTVADSEVQQQKLVLESQLAAERLSVAQSTLDAYTNDLNALKQHNQDITQNFEASEQSVQDLRSQVNKLEEERRDAAAEFEKLQFQKNVLEENNSQLKKNTTYQIEMAKADRNTLVDELQQLENKQSQEMKKVNDELEGNKDKLYKLRLEMDELLDDQVWEREQIKTQQEQLINVIAENNSQVQRLTGQIDEVQSQIQERDERLLLLQSQLSKEQKSNEERIKTQELEEERLRKKLAEQEAALNEATSNFENASQENAQLSEKKIQLQSQMDVLNEQLRSQQESQQQMQTNHLRETEELVLNNQNSIAELTSRFEAQVKSLKEESTLFEDQRINLKEELTREYEQQNKETVKLYEQKISDLEQEQIKSLQRIFDQKEKNDLEKTIEKRALQKTYEGELDALRQENESKMINLQSELEQKKSELDQKKTEFQRGQEELQDKINAQNQVHSVELQRIEERHGKEIQEAIKSQSEIQDIKTDLDQKLQKAQSDLELSQQKVREFAQSNQSQNKKITDMTQEIDTVRQDMVAMTKKNQSQSQKIQSQKQKIMVLESQSKNSKLKLDEKESELQKTKLENERVQGLLSSSQHLQQEKEKQIRKAENDLKNLQGNLDKEKREFDQQLQIMESQSQGAIAMTAELQLTKERLVNDLTEKQNSINELTEKLQSLITQHNSMMHNGQTQLSEAQSKIQNLESQLTQSTGLEFENSQLVRELNDVTKRFERLDKEYQLVLSENGINTKQILDLQNKRAALKNFITKNCQGSAFLLDPSL